MKGRFITFEGGEGCGKSTQVRRLKEALEAEGHEVLLTREPGGTRLSELIRGLLKDEREDPPCDRAELLLFLAARAQLVRSVIRPALDAGTWVVSDRFSDSTFAYQGYGRGLPLEVIDIANTFACENLKPDLTLLLEVDPTVAAARLAGREQATRRAGPACARARPRPTRRRTASSRPGTRFTRGFGRASSRWPRKNRTASSPSKPPARRTRSGRRYGSR